MTAMDYSVGVIGELSRDPSFAGATLHLDTTKWTTRRRNIVLRALRDGVTNCGYDTSIFIDKLTRAYGANVHTMTKYGRNIPLDKVREDKVEELMAYTCAWMKLGIANKDEYVPYWYSSFLEAVGNGITPQHIPAPDISPKEQTEFIKKYIKDDESEKDSRESLARKIENGEKLIIHVDAYRD